MQGKVSCTNCADEGWVCENHPDKTWNKEGCECGAGAPCPVCNPSEGEHDPPRMQPGFKTDLDKDGWRH
jgi:hypothetical protein